MLILHDTTEFSYQREKPELVGTTKSINCGRDEVGRSRLRTICGIMMHSSLAVTTEGLSLGLAAIKFWTGKKSKRCNALKKQINPTRVPIEEKESIRWLENLKRSTELLDRSARDVRRGQESFRRSSRPAPRRRQQSEAGVTRSLLPVLKLRARMSPRNSKYGRWNRTRTRLAPEDSKSAVSAASVALG